MAATWILLGLLAGLAARGEAERDPAADDLDVALSVARAQARAVERARPSVVAIRAFKAEDEDYGAGILVDPTGRVLTAHHVIRGASALSVRPADGTEYSARILAVEPELDLALLAIDAPNRTFLPAALSGGHAVRAGEPVLALGTPFGLEGSVSLGVISATERAHVATGATVSLLQTDAAINPGSSGGPLVNLRGEVVGLVTSILTKSGGHQGIGFALSAADLRYALPFLSRGEPVTRAWLGFRVREQPGVGGALVVVSTVAGGPSDRAGVAPGDVILTLHGVPVQGLRGLREFLREADTGQRIRIGLRRGAETIEVEVTASTRADGT